MELAGFCSGKKFKYILKTYLMEVNTLTKIMVEFIMQKHSEINKTTWNHMFIDLLLISEWYIDTQEQLYLFG